MHKSIKRTLYPFVLKCTLPALYLLIVTVNTKVTISARWSVHCHTILIGPSLQNLQETKRKKIAHSAGQKFSGNLEVLGEWSCLLAKPRHHVQNCCNHGNFPVFTAVDESHDCVGQKLWSEDSLAVHETQCFPISDQKPPLFKHIIMSSLARSYLKLNNNHKLGNIYIWRLYKIFNEWIK